MYNEKELTEERQEHLKLIDEKKKQFVSYCHDLNCVYYYYNIISSLSIIKDSLRDLGKIDRKTDRNGHYSGQSLQTKESWSKTLLKLCTKRERRY